MRQANVDRALRASDDVLACGPHSKRAIRGRSTLEGPCGIRDKAPGARLIQVLVRIHQAGCDQLAVQVDDPFRRPGRNRWHQRCDPAVLSDRQIEPLRILGAAAKHAAVREKKQYAGQAEVPTTRWLRADRARGPTVLLLYTNQSYGYNTFQ